MTQTTISPLVYSEDEYNIAALLTQSSIKKVIFIQDQLKKILADAIWLTPPNILHITLMEITCNTEYKNMPRMQYFLNWYKAYNKTTNDIIIGIPSFYINFDQLHVSSNAIILKSSNPTPFNNVRNSLLSKIILPEETKVPPKITHITIARFNKAVDLETTINQTRLIKVNFTEHLTKFTLLKDLVPPDFNPKVIETYNLGN